MSELARRVAQRYVEAADNTWQAAKMMPPEAFAAVIYVLLHGGDSDEIRGDKLVEVLHDQDAKDALNAKRAFDDINLAVPQFSELDMRFVVETVKKNKSAVGKLAPEDRKRLGWVTQAMTAVVRYARALKAARRAGNVTEGEATTQVTELLGKLSTLSKAVSGRSYLNPDAGSEEEAKLTDAMIAALEKEGLVDDIVDTMVTSQLARSFTLSTMNGPTISAADAEILLGTADYGAALDEAFTYATKVDAAVMLLSRSSLSFLHNKTQAATTFRYNLDSAIKTQVHSRVKAVKTALSREVPVTLVWALCKKATGGKVT